MGRGRALLTPAVSAVDAAALVVLRPHPVRLAHRLTHAATWVARQSDAALAELVGTALWLVAAWLGIGLVAALLARLPGAVGAAGRRVAAVALPRVLRQLVVGSVGVGIALTPIAASAATPGTAVASASVPSPVWPTSPPASTPASTPAPRWPVSPPTPATRPAPRVPPPSAPTSASNAETSVRVRAGNTLWQLAAHRLGPAPQPQHVAHYWQRIYATNRAVIGADPDRIDPGQQLVLPAPTAQELP